MYLLGKSFFTEGLGFLHRRPCAQYQYFSHVCFTRKQNSQKDCTVVELWSCLQQPFLSTPSLYIHPRWALLCSATPTYAELCVSTLTEYNYLVPC